MKQEKTTKSRPVIEIPNVPAMLIIYAVTQIPVPSKLHGKSPLSLSGIAAWLILLGLYPSGLIPLYKNKLTRISKLCRTSVRSADWWLINYLVFEGLATKKDKDLILEDYPVVVSRFGIDITREGLFTILYNPNRPKCLEESLVDLVIAEFPPATIEKLVKG